MTDDTNGDIERLLAVAAPRKAPPELRSIVIAAVASKPDRQNAPGRPWVGRAVAASFLASVAASAGVGWFEDRRLAYWDGQPVVRSDVAEVVDAVASVAGDAKAQAIEHCLLSRLSTEPAMESADMSEDVREIQRWARGG